MNAGTRRPRAVVASTIPITLNTFHRELIRQLGETHDVHVVSSPGPHLDALSNDLHLTKHPVPMSREIAPLWDLVSFIRWMIVLNRVRPDVLVTATPKASLLGQLAGVISRVRHRLYYVGGLRLEGATGRKRALLLFMERATGAAATHVVGNSDSLVKEAQALKLWDRAKLHTTDPGSSHGVDSNHFTPTPADTRLFDRLGLIPETLIVGFVGRLTHDKGVDQLLGASRAMLRDAVNYQLLIVGPQDEPDSAHYLDLLRASGLPLKVVGAVEDMRPLYSLIDVLALPSKREGFPNVVLEAAAVGIPTVTTNATGCIDSVIDGHTGYVVALGDDEALALALGRLLTDSDLRTRLGRQARERIIADFQPERVVASLLRPLGLNNQGAR